MKRVSIDEAIKKVRKRIGEKKKYVETHCVTQEFYADIDCYEQLAEWLEELKQYKNAEEQVLLLRLPCKVGTQIYMINHYRIDEGSICGIAEADELVKLLKANTMSNGTLINTNTMVSIIEKMPTAYDVEKIMEELENEIKWAETHGTSVDFRKGRVSGLKTAIRVLNDIVKRVV